MYHPKNIQILCFSIKIYYPCILYKEILIVHNDIIIFPFLFKADRKRERTKTLSNRMWRIEISNINFTSKENC